MYSFSMDKTPQTTNEIVIRSQPGAFQPSSYHEPDDPMPSGPMHVDFAQFESPANVQHHGQGYVSTDEERRTGLDENHRFVAGEQFYNYEMYGSLRKGGLVKFFSWESFGLLVGTFSSALSYQCLQSITRPYMTSQLNLSSQENSAIQRIIELPMALSFFVGLVSDSFPIMGLRRKSYMVVGLVLNAISVIALACLSMHLESLDTMHPPQWVVILSIIMIALASFGCIITYVAVQTRTIELSQREPLRLRGSIIAEYLIFRRFVSLFGSAFSYVTQGGGNKPRIAFSTTMFLLAFICALPLPVILLYWREENYNLASTLKVRSKIFWKIMQQKAVWRVLMFVALFAFFLSIRFSDSSSAIRRWAGASNDNSTLVRTIQDVVVIITIGLWRAFFLNTNWIKFFCWAPIMQTLPGLLATILVAFDIERNRYLYRVLISFVEVAGGITTLNPIIPLTEIIQEGSEAATVGLTLTLQRLINVFVNTNSQGLFNGDNFFDYNEMKQDTHHVRWSVFWSILLNYGINLLALLGLFFLPVQKLDAQQLRMYGGFTKAASIFILIFASVLFMYNLTMNIMTFVPSFSCYQLVGGKGCE
ncbi:hypothetical protein Poli38472_009325 [Pythium oligandrum]|uniref:Transmembrane protein n=1 Tax=Pythium oligandrum TaxID=41045 RepID=A0A8K1FP06_PYTOL|nr:hypothetical protein Poli38472_009325 [Pythium oligandrum]|eukprot:TMW65158.1 hypothetical protein Poli38472_009325 [Pythium oligandrum]